MVEQNKKYIVDITSVSSDGNGVGHIDGLAVFIPHTASGDTAEVEITKVKSRYAVGRLIRIIGPSSDRVDAPCAVYKRCGGCQLIHINYTAQLREKKNIVENAIRRIGGFTDFSLSNIIGMENPLRYRNKMIFHVSDGGKCGFYETGSHTVTEISDCILGGEHNSRIIAAVKEYMSENGEFIKQIFTRSSRDGSEIMVVISINGKDIPHRESLVAKLRAADSRILGIILDNGKNTVLYGADYIHDTLCGIEFKISPQSFFQINPIQTERLYTQAIEFADLSGAETVMDIYCGIGTISLCAAKKAKKVIGIEIVPEAIRDAKENARINGIKNAEFYAGSAETLVPKLIESIGQPDAVILDPPRKGSDEATLGAITAAMPKRIVYVSCNPATLARDARFIAERGYEIADAISFDMFPNTAHIETVMLLKKI